MKLIGLTLLAIGLSATTAIGAPTVYSGFDVSFSKSSFADPFVSPNFDSIVNDVALSRGDTAGILNVAQESSFVTNTSPVGTAWAFKSNNPGKTIAATNWADLTFADWQSSLGGGGNLATAILDGSGVLHLIDADIYLDIRFTAWGVGSPAGGSFAYERAAIIPVPEPASLIAISLASIAILAIRRL
jgi:hypothetical protein